MKRFRLILLILIGMAVFLAACPYPGSPTQDPVSLQTLTPFQDPHVNAEKEPYPSWDPEQCNGQLEYRDVLLYEWMVGYLVDFCIDKGDCCGWVERVSQSASDSYPWEAPTHTLFQDPHDSVVRERDYGLTPNSWIPDLCDDQFENCKLLLYEHCSSYLASLCAEQGARCDDWVEEACQYASDSYPWDTSTQAACDFDCDCEPKQGENEFNCPKDCPKHCGNGTCDCGETSHNCKKDCKLDCECGNGICQPGCGETPNTCLSDC